MIVYLCSAPNAEISHLRTACIDAASAYGWGVSAYIEDRMGLLPPEGRTGLAQALRGIENGEAGAIVTPWRSMISPLPEEYDEIAHQIEKAGGFLYVLDSDRSRD
ncbi:hypothetical protein [Streptomyces buecherae]|uniref:hypothetical protein n=1 Tax=Streptomyces buecherae TaxID=2763006 RepID=UPI0036500DB4